MTNTKKIIKIVGKTTIVISFIIFTLLIANYHEHWADEAQSFLVARDTSLADLLGYMKYEGTPPLWVLLIKLFIFLGGTYDTFFILPIIASSLGLIIFEFKIKAPWYIKILFPFTYFFLYQYTIVARSYCLIFPAFMMLAVVYEKRFEKPFLYSIVLLFLMNISLHTLIISGSLYLLFLIETIKNKEFKKIKVIIACILIFLELLVATMCTLPEKDCAYASNRCEGIQYIITECTVGSDENNIIQIGVTIAFFIMIFYIMLKKDIFDMFEFAILFIPVICIYLRVTCQDWHIGIIWILLFSYFIIKKFINESHLISCFVILVCCVQICWTSNASIYDIFENYSASEEVANFIKKYDYNEIKIHGLGYSVTAIQPYFESNIFDNKNSNKAFNFWKIPTDYTMTEEFFSDDVDMYVFSNFYITEKEIAKYLDKSLYEEYVFNGYTFMKDGIHEPEGYIIWVKK